MEPQRFAREAAKSAKIMPLAPWHLGAFARASRRKVRLSACIALALLLMSSSAFAHSFAHPKVLHVIIDDDQLRLSITYDISPGEEARLLRSLFDRDADGTLRPEEQQKLAEYLEDTAMLFLAIAIDGTAVSLTRLEARANRIHLPADATETMGVALAYSAPLPKVLPGGQLTIEIKDREKDSRKHVPALVELAARWQVVLSSQGELDPKSRAIRNVRLAPESRLTMRLRSTPKPTPD